MKLIERWPRKVSEKALSRLNEVRKVVLVLGRTNRISVWDLSTYEKQKKGIHENKPWEKRQKKTFLNPLVADHPLGVKGSLSRDKIYDYL